MTEKAKLQTKIVTPKTTCSYPYLFEVSDYTGKYGLSVPISKDDKKSLNEIRTAIGNAAENKWGKKAREQIGKKIKSPLRDGDTEKDDDDTGTYGNTIFFSANSAKAPGVVNAQCQQIMDADEIYAGCIVRASVNFYAYDYKGKKGVAAGLNNVMKAGEGTPLGSASSAADDFAEFAEESDSSFDFGANAETQEAETTEDEPIF